MTDQPPLLTGDLLHERAARALGLPLPAALGIRLVDVTFPEAGAALGTGDLLDNGAGGAHAGALHVLLEVAGYLALMPLLTALEHAVTHVSTCSLPSAAPPGQEIRARGTVDHRSRRLALVSVTARAGASVVARASLAKTIVPLRT